MLLAEPGRPAGSPLSIAPRAAMPAADGGCSGRVPGTEWAWPSLLAHVKRFVRSRARTTGHLGMALALLEAAVAHIIAQPLGCGGSEDDESGGMVCVSVCCITKVKFSARVKG